MEIKGKSPLSKTKIPQTIKEIIKRLYTLFARKLIANAARLQSYKTLLRVSFSLFSLALFFLALQFFWQKPESQINENQINQGRVNPARRTAQKAAESGAAVLPLGEPLSCANITQEFIAYHDLMQLSLTAFGASLRQVIAFLRKIDQTEKLKQEDLRGLIQQMDEAGYTMADNKEALWDRYDNMMDYLEECAGSQ